MLSFSASRREFAEYNLCVAIVRQEKEMCVKYIFNIMRINGIRHHLANGYLRCHYSERPHEAQLLLYPTFQPNAQNRLNACQETFFFC